MVVKQALVAASQTNVMHAAATTTPLARSVARRFVAGEHESEAVDAAATLAASGMHCSIEYLGPQPRDEGDCTETVTANLRLLESLGDADLLDRAELSIKLTDLGIGFPDGAVLALENARTVVARAVESGTSVTVDTENYDYVHDTLDIVEQLRSDFPTTGAVIQAYLRRSEVDCSELNGPGSRVRLVKGAFAEDEDVAYESAQEIDLSYVRCLKQLMIGKGTPMIATHDPRLIDIGCALAVRTGRERHSYEFQMLYGVRDDEQKRLAATGERVRVFVPYGPAWYPYLVRRMAEKPANLALFARALTGR